MKKIVVWAAVAVLLAMGCSGCRNSGSGTTVPSEEKTVSVPSGMPQESFPVMASADMSSADVSAADTNSPTVSEPSAADQSLQEISEEDEVQYPVGVAPYSNGKLRFTTSVLSLSVVFPEEFCVLNTDYYPSYGIYLQNVDETATLLLESVVDKTLTYRQMADYLQHQYPTARVSTTDTKDVVCRMTMTDPDGHALYVQQKIRVRSGGYNAAVLCCRAEDRTQYERLFNEITFH